MFCGILIAVCLNYNFYLTNEFKPGGDGTRIYRYLKYMEKVPEIFPSWNAHKHHGYPLLANPEHYFLLSADVLDNCNDIDCCSPTTE